MNKFNWVVGGVETQMRSLMSWQRECGFDVELFTLENVPGEHFDAEASRLPDQLRSASTLIWSRRARKALELTANRFGPDVIHLHNFSHHLSPSVLRVAGTVGAANVVTAHDYKLVAPCYLMFRDGHECSQCVGRKLPLPAISHRCVKGSATKSSLCTAEHLLHRRIYLNELDAVIAPSRVSADYLAGSDSVHGDCIHVVPHGVELAEPGHPQADATVVVYAGRLAPEKGVDTLLKAWRLAALPGDSRLVIAGEGSERERLEALGRGQDVEFVGKLDSFELSGLIGKASLVVVPSRFPETFCLAAAEAMSRGVPVLVSDAGNLPELVGNEELVVPRDRPELWASAMARLLEDRTSRDRVGRELRERVRSTFSVDHCGEETTRVYEKAISKRALAD